MKKRARRYVGAGRKEWLYPENAVTEPWSELRKTLLPPEGGMFHFGGEIFVKYKSGDVHYQDEFGRTEKPRKFLIKNVPDKPLRPGDYCGCGRGKSFKGGVPSGEGNKGLLRQMLADGWPESPSGTRVLISVDMLRPPMHYECMANEAP